MKTVDVYKHSTLDGLCIYVDPETKKLSSNLAMSMELLKVFEENPQKSLVDLISNGIFVKVCDVIIEVTKVPKIYPCQWKNCSLAFTNQNERMKHMNSCQFRTSIEVKNTKYQCKWAKCSNSFTDQLAQMKHIQSCQFKTELACNTLGKKAVRL